MTLRSAVVGAGRVSGQHLSGLKKCPKTNLVAVCDIEESKARNAARKYDISPYFDVDEMLSEESLDWIHICTSVQSHLALATTALQAGVPALIEKPVTSTVEEFEQLVDVAEGASVRFSVVHNHLYDPAFRAAQERIASGQLGSIRAVEVSYSGLTAPDDHHRGSWVFDLPGGEFAEGLPHPIYLGIEGAGLPAHEESISAQTSLSKRYNEGFTYDAAQVQYVSENNTLCSIQMHSGSTPQKMLRIHGETETILVDLLSQTLITLDRDYSGSKTGFFLNSTDRILARTRGVFVNAIRYVLQAYRSGWEAERRLNPNYYIYDLEAEAIERGEGLDVDRARWTIRLLEAIRTAATTDSSAETQHSRPIQ